MSKAPTLDIIQLDAPLVELYSMSPIHQMPEDGYATLLIPGNEQGPHPMRVLEPYNPGTSRTVLKPIAGRFAQAPGAGIHVKHGTYMFRVTGDCTKTRLVIEGPYGEGVLPHA